MSDEFAQFKQTYITECHELLGDMEELLLGLDVSQPEDDTLHAIFRCAHSIKGGAGAFGLDRIVSFTHVAEFLLDSLREHQVALTDELVDALLRSVDVMNKLVQAAENDREVEG